MARAGKVLMYFGISVLILFTACKSKKKKHSEPIKSNVAVDNDISKELEFYTIQHAKIEDKDKVIGHCDTNLIKEKPESLLGNLVADAILDRAQTKMLDSLGLPVNFCVLNYGSLRAPIKKGIITLENIYSMMPYDLKIDIVKLNGIDVVELFETMAKRGCDPVSGLQLTISDSGKYEFAFINGRPFDSRRDYYIATSDFIANGNDGFEIMKKGTVISSSILIRTAIIDYIQAYEIEGKPINPKLEGRISIDKP